MSTITRLGASEHALTSLDSHNTPLGREVAVDPSAMFDRDQSRRGLRPRTIEKRRDDMANFDRFMRARGGGVLTATRDDIEAWLDSKGGISSNTRANYISGLKALYECMIHERILVTNPTAEVVRPKVRHGLPRPCTDDELRIALKYAPPRERCFIALAAFAGLRCQEIAHLNVEDLIWARRTLLVTEFAAKGGKERMVPIHPTVEEALRAYGLPKQGAVFTGRAGKRYSPERVSQLGYAYLESAGLGLTMHQFRHWFGTDLARKAPLRTVQELMGHASPTSTAIYTRVTVDDLFSAVASLQAP